MKCLDHGTLILPDSVVKDLSKKGEYKAKLMQYLKSSHSVEATASGNIILLVLSMLHVAKEISYIHVSVGHYAYVYILGYSVKLSPKTYLSIII